LKNKRYEAVRACRWVDEVVEDAPYTTQLSYLEKYNCDFVVHGDDLVMTSDGTDCYEQVKKANKFKTVKRTEGVSTTDLVGRMLLLTKSHHKSTSNDEQALEGVNHNSLKSMTSIPETQGKSYTKISHFLPTSRKIVQFSEGLHDPKTTDKIVYIDGGFDLFHIGHILALKDAKEMGDYLIVGIHTDEDINRVRGANHPVMNIHERVLSVLSCKYVNEVVIGAPWKITKEMIDSMKINLVLSGVIRTDSGTESCYEVPIKLGIYKQIESKSDLTTTTVISRILKNFELYDKRNKKKEAKEALIILENETK
jgi:ethanolamine-phosphate cytidylyltransferase